MQTKQLSSLINGVLIGCALLGLPLLSSAQTEVPERYKKFIVHSVDRRAFSEKALNLIGMSHQDVGRSFALIAGVSKYPYMSRQHANLTPAAWDITRLIDYFKSHEFFDEIVVLAESDVTIGNLSFFLTRYFPQKLTAFPKSRFVFAYSGHGMTHKSKGYLLTDQARHLTDRTHSIPLHVVRSLFQEIIDSGYHVLALINSCYSGSFLARPFGGKSYYLPKYPGAHAITAGGTGEKSWHDGTIGEGSIFFEKFFAGLDGRADFLPAHPDGSSGDGIVTINELRLYLQQEISLFTDQRQNPQSSDLSLHGSQGGIFFLNRQRQVEQGVLPRWSPAQNISFGYKPIDATMSGSPPQPPQQPPLMSNLPHEFTNSIGMDFVLIPAGTFKMGSSDSSGDIHDEEKPAHDVTISRPFYISKYEVTQGQWQAVMGTTVKEQRDRDSQNKDEPLRGVGDKYPMYYVSWFDVQEFIQNINKISSTISCRLPTEAEWEYAARAGSLSRYGFGDNPEKVGEYAWGEDNSRGKAHPVGTRLPNKWLLYDMHGNVWEWVQDWYSPDFYQESPKVDPKGPNSGSDRVVRGGGWDYPSYLVRVTYRDKYDPIIRSDAVGFRCVSLFPEENLK